MSVIDGLKQKELEQLKQDALNTRTTLLTRGWTTGHLILFPSPEAHGRGEGRVCMTGAAGCGVEKSGFIAWVKRAMTGKPDGYQWKDSTKILLRLLAEVGGELYRPGSFGDDFFMRGNGVNNAVSAIISVNDGECGSPDRAMAWVDKALQRVEERLEQMNPPKVEKPQVESGTKLLERLFAKEEGEQEYELHRDV